MFLVLGALRSTGLEAGHVAFARWSSGLFHKFQIGVEAGPELIFHLLCFFGRQLSTILLSVDIGPQLLSLNLGIEAAHGCGVPFDSRVELQRAHAVRLLSFLEPREKRQRLKNSRKPIYSKL